MKIYCVIADAGGAWEAECVYSLWDSLEKAEKEFARLTAEDVPAGCYSGEFKIAEAELNVSSDNWIPHQDAE